MHHSNIDTAVRARLCSIADALLWEGQDYAADAIYAVMEGTTPSEPARPVLRLVHDAEAIQLPIPL